MITMDEEYWDERQPNGYVPNRCGRCNVESGVQGHWTSICKVLLRQKGTSLFDAKTDFHFCCPMDCTLYPDGVVTMDGGDYV